MQRAQVLLPEVNALFGVPQRADYHPEIDSGIHTLMTLQRTTPIWVEPARTLCRPAATWAKPKHRPTSCRATTDTTSCGVEPVREVNQRLRAPKHCAGLPNWFAVGTLFSTKSDSLKAKPF